MPSKTMVIRSPFDGSVVGEVERQTVDAVDQAVTEAHEAKRANPLPAWQRAEILTRASDFIAERREDLAVTISRESAKPISGARTEASRALSTLGFAAIEARKIAGEVIPMEGSMIGEGKLAWTTRHPVGVVGAISPFNFPLNLVCHKIAPAIAAGCPVVLKPSGQTPFSALALAEVLADAGLPDGWFSIVTGEGPEIGGAIVDHPGIAYVSFTGSSEVGWALTKRAPRKRVALELGNSTPLLIEPDGDWESAAHAAVVGGFSHAGQSCISVQRVYVHRDIAEPFIDTLVEQACNLPVGDPFDETTALSSLITEADQQRVHGWVEEAVEQGATLRCGNEIDGTLLTPSVLVDTTLDMRVAKDEVFGPVVAVATYETLDEAIELANGTRFGLQAGIFTADLGAAMRATNELEFGGVIVNEVPTWRADIMPYGGMKDSGNTREGPAYAVREMTEPRLAIINL